MRFQFRRTTLTAAVLILVAPWAVSAEPIVAGWIENAWLGGAVVKFKAKLDTGAKSSSINARVFAEFERDGARWVRFTLTNTEGEILEVERNIARYARIKRSGTETMPRPVILLNVCVAGQTSEAEFTLADRSHMNYQVLIGRTFLADRILVDSSRTYLGSGRCVPR